ncbi:MAG: thermonuclease family protein [Bacilli bacterium]|nr:thermonuclease family protein [Bacilli bacterium]MDD4076936.1 thermonuclease family protein [Bacilli bacterium]MDD4387646.1 thermonuclease family protein [Bacilli bacterium]
MNKKNFKKFIKLLFVLLLGFSFASCKKDPNNGDNGKKPPITVDELKTEYTDDLKLVADYTKQKFLTHGIGTVSLLRVIDGDTAHFSQEGKFETIKIRFLGINTPESTIRIAPWGLKASAYVSQKLENAYEIVLESNEIGKPPVFDTTGERYLGYVWYRPSKDDDLRLLNLEVIEQCFSYFTGGDAEKYCEVFQQAFLKSYDTGLRVFGELDSDFNYSTETYEITIAELRNNYSSYSTGVTLKVKAQVIRKVGKSLYLEDLEETLNADTGEYTKEGIFLYHAFTSGMETIASGDIIEFNCQATDTKDYGMQLTNPHKIRIRETGTAITIREVDESLTSLQQYEGFVVKVYEFTVTSVGKAADKDGAYTIKGKMKNGAELQVRIDGDVTPKLLRGYVTVGMKYDVIGGVSKFVDVYNNNKVYYQIKLGNITEQTVNDFVLSENQ